MATQGSVSSFISPGGWLDLTFIHSFCSRACHADCEDRYPALLSPAKGSMQLFMWQPETVGVVHSVMNSSDLHGAAPDVIRVTIVMIVTRTRTHRNQPWRLDSSNNSFIVPYTLNVICMTCKVTLATCTTQLSHSFIQWPLPMVQSSFAHSHFTCVKSLLHTTQVQIENRKAVAGHTLLQLSSRPTSIHAWYMLAP